MHSHVGRHPPFICSKAQVNGGDAKPNWYKIEHKRAKQDGREPDYRWGENVSHTDVDAPQDSQCPVEEPQPQCAAAAMMHGPSMAAASSWQGSCPTIAEHQEWKPPVPTRHVLWPNPGYKTEANLWNLNIPDTARHPGPLASFLRHCNTMERPYIPSYGKGGTEPIDEMVWFDHNVSMENLRELQKYSKKLQFEATCCRLWANGILDQIMDEQEKIQHWIASMTNELIRLRRIQPAWIHQMQQVGPPPMPQASMPAPSIQQPQPASSSAASSHTVKPAPVSRNPSMASAPRNAPFPGEEWEANPWAEARQQKHQ